MIFIILWTLIVAFLALYLGKSPKVRGWIKVLWRAKRLRRDFLVTVAVIATIALAYVLIPAAQEQDTDERDTFEKYAAQAVLKLDTLQKVIVDSTCDLSHPRPELAYVLPQIIGAYNEIVNKPTTPIITRLDDTLFFAMPGYKQFKNRGIRLAKLLRKKLGNRYALDMESTDQVHTMIICYTGEPWDNEQLTALPVMEASGIYNIDPALLMSLIRHVSNFDFDYRGQKDRRGLLALEQGEGLEQVFMGAERLHKILSVGVSMENAVASFYPDPAIGSKPENWSKSPLTKSWVSQVLGDVQFYRENGMGALRN